MYGLVPLVVIKNGTLAGISTDRDVGCWLAAPGVTQFRPGSGRSNSCAEHSICRLSVSKCDNGRIGLMLVEDLACSTRDLSITVLVAKPGVELGVETAGG